MSASLPALLVAVGLLASPVAWARNPPSNSHTAPHSSTGGDHKTADVPRDSHGKIQRSAKAKSEFKHVHPCPSTGKSSGKCPGYVIDHVTPLKRGGADDPSNMQWQSKADAKAKDKVE